MSKMVTFLTAVEGSIAQQDLAKLTLSKPRDKSLDFKNVFVRLVRTKKGLQLCFVYRHATRDVTKNHSVDSGMAVIRELVSNAFVHADLFRAESEWHLTIDKRGNVSLKRKEKQRVVPKNLEHDKTKKRLIELKNNIYLLELGVITSDWQVKRNSEDKYRQINKFVEVVGGIIQKQGLEGTGNIFDMGSGKGYLTFALYDYLSQTLGLDPKLVGIELRPHLVDTCNRIAKLAKFDGLEFRAGAIDQVDLAGIEILIALHACDTATDDAIYRGIQAQAKIIISAPCCHKQLREQIKPSNELQEITRFGILEERQSEILTDGLRALILESQGYRTKVFEFISTEHTPKNVMIVAIKDQNAEGEASKKLAEIEAIKKLYNIEYHYLERLLNGGCAGTKTGG